MNTNKCSICKEKNSFFAIKIYDFPLDIKKIYYLCENCKKKFDNRFNIYFFNCSRCKRTFYKFNNDTKLPNYTKFNEENLCINCLKKELIINGTPISYFSNNILLGSNFEDNELEDNHYRNYSDYLIKNNDDFLGICHLCEILVEEKNLKVIVEHRYIESTKLKTSEITIWTKKNKCE